MKPERARMTRTRKAIMIPVYDFGGVGGVGAGRIGGGRVGSAIDIYTPREYFSDVWIN